MDADGYLFIHKDRAVVCVTGTSDEAKAKEYVERLLPLSYMTAGHDEEINDDDLVCCPIFEHEGVVAVAWAPKAPT